MMNKAVMAYFYKIFHPMIFNLNAQDGKLR